MLSQFQVFSKVSLLYTYIDLLFFRFFPLCCLVAQSCLTLATPQTVAHQAPLFKGFSRQEYWSRLPFPSPGDLPDPGVESMSPALLSEPPGKPGVCKRNLANLKQRYSCSQLETDSSKQRTIGKMPLPALPLETAQKH